MPVRKNIELEKNLEGKKTQNTQKKSRWKGIAEEKEEEKEGVRLSPWAKNEERVPNCACRTENYRLLVTTKIKRRGKLRKKGESRSGGKRGSHLRVENKCVQVRSQLRGEENRISFSGENMDGKKDAGRGGDFK